MKGNFEIVSEVENDDGTYTLNCDVDDEFKDWFKEWQGLSRWSDKRFQKVIVEAITAAIDKAEKDNIMNETDANEQNNDHYTTIVQENEAGELYIELPQKMMDQLGWNIGDDVEWEETEICENWGEHKGFTLSNLTKNPKVEPSE